MPSAEIYIDGKLVAAAEEECFLRNKHAKGKITYEATRCCLDFAGIKPEQIDIIAFSYTQISLKSPVHCRQDKKV